MTRLLTLRAVLTTTAASLALLALGRHLHRTGGTR